MEVEMDIAGVHHHHHHHQQQQQEEISSQTLESILVSTKPQEDKKPKPPEEALKCPRCDSSNTKFCYYNNYSLTQPRYFCKSCRRYWTKGGTLRNVPVGGGCRKNKRHSSATSSSNSSSCSVLISSIRGPQDHHLTQQHPLNHLLSGLPNHLPYDSTDLSLAYARLQNQANGSMGYDHFDHTSHHLISTNGDQFGFLENPTNPNRFDHHNVVYNGGNLGNGDMGSLGNLNNIDGHHDQQQILNPMFHDHQEQEQELTCSVATTLVTTTPVIKQEACNMMRSSEGGLWGFPGTMVHEVEPGRSMIGGWNVIGSTNWHGLINSPLM